MWNETYEYFTTVTDKLGKKIDSGILEAVVAFNVLGMTTRQSCQGHLDWGHPYPWVDLIADNLDTKFRLHSYLRQFYADRATDFDCLLVFQGYRLFPRGGTFSDLRSEGERAEKLLAYQAEMQDFTQFLKQLIA